MQFARPIADITSGWSALNWTDTANLWGAIAEPIADDARGIRTANNPAGVEYEALLSRIAAPADASNLTLRARLFCTAGTADVVLRIRQGTTEIAATTAAVTTTTTVHTLAVPVASITDYTDLRVELVATKTSGGSMSVRCVWTVTDGADDVGPAIVTELRALNPWALYRFREGGGAVINDEKGNAHMAAADGQGTAYAARPTFAQPTMLPDGADTSVAFDGVNDEVESAGFTPYLGNATIVALLKAGAVASRAANETLFRSQAAGTAGLVAIQWGAAGQYVLHWRDDAAAGTFTDLWTPAEDDVDLIFIVTDGTDLRVYRNGSTTPEFTTTAQTAQGHDEIGVGANKTSDAFAEFDIQTLAVYRTALTETNRLDIHAALTGAGETVDAAIVLPAVTADASLSSTADADVSATLPEVTASADLSSRSTTDVSAELPRLDASADLSAMATVDASAELPALEVAATLAEAGTAETVTVNAVLPILGADADFISEADLTVDATLPAVTADASLSAAATVDASATLPALEAAAELTSTTPTVDADVVLPALTADAALGAASNLTVDATLPTLTLNVTLTPEQILGPPIIVGAIASPATDPTIASPGTSTDPVYHQAD